MRISSEKQRNASTRKRWRVFAGVFSGGSDEDIAPVTQTDLAIVEGVRNQRADGADGRILARVAVEERRIEKAVHALAAGLTLAREAERKRVAGELHDGINQDVAVIAIDLGLLAQGLPTSDLKVRQEVLRIQGMTFALSNELRRLSHDLHPSVVEHFRLSASLRIYCREFERREGIEVKFTTRNLSARYSGDIELAFYRICQETLCNVRKHAHASVVRVTLQAKRGGVFLTVADNGCGFDVSAPARGDGIGLISMSERARLSGGYVIIRSQIGIGTELEAFIPLKHKGPDPEPLDAFRFETDPHGSRSTARPGEPPERWAA